VIENSSSPPERDTRYSAKLFAEQFRAALTEAHAPER
jgi:hypothetical protein